MTNKQPPIIALLTAFEEMILAEYVEGETTDILGGDNVLLVRPVKVSVAYDEASGRPAPEMTPYGHFYAGGASGKPIAFRSTAFISARQTSAAETTSYLQHVSGIAIAKA